MPLSGLRVLDLSDHAGALCSRLLGELGADVVRVEPPGGADIRRIEPLHAGESLAHLYANRGKRWVELDSGANDERERLVDLIRVADVVIDGRSMASGGSSLQAESLVGVSDDTIVVRVTPFGSQGPRAHWQGSDLVCAARSGMMYVNGHAEEEPIAPFGLAAYAATGLVGALAACLALASRDRTGRGARIDLSVAAAATGALEHVTALLRQTGITQRRHGTLHWSRTFRAGQARDGLVLLSHLGDWTTLSEWAASEAVESKALTDPRWQDLLLRREHAEHIFDLLDLWLAGKTVEEACAGAEVRRLLLTPVRRPEALSDDEQLAARGFVERVEVAGKPIGVPGAPWGTSLRTSDAAVPPGRTPVDLEDVRRSWPPRDGSTKRDPKPEERPLDGIVVLDFTWVVAGPVATRVLADHGARIVKVEHKNAASFGTRRDGLTGNLNRGKQSIVIDMETEAGRALAHRLAERSDVVIDNFSARVMDGWGLDYASLRSRKEDAISVRLTGFGLDGPTRDRPSYGPTLQALVGFPYLMRTPGGAPAGWGYSWSDMVGGLTGAIATLAALRHRERTGEGQCVDLSQFESLVSMLGPRALDLLAGRTVEPPGNRSQEGPRTPQGVFRCASDGDDDDRWLALSIADDEMWDRFAELLVEDGELWAADADLGRYEGRLQRADEIEASLRAWSRPRGVADLEVRLQDRSIAAALVATGADVAEDPQLRHRGYFEQAGAPGEARHAFDGIPFLSSLLPGRVAAPGPLCGEHTDSVLSELLGFGSEEIAELRAQEVIG